MKDCVVFDEISKIGFANPDGIMDKPKDYMESGYFERSRKGTVPVSWFLWMIFILKNSGEGYRWRIASYIPPCS